MEWNCDGGVGCKCDGGVGCNCDGGGGINDSWTGRFPCSCVASGKNGVDDGVDSTNRGCDACVCAVASCACNTRISSSSCAFVFRETFNLAALPTAFCAARVTFCAARASAS